MELGSTRTGNGATLLPVTRERLHSRLSDIEQALREARSADVRELLSDLLDRCRQELAVLDGGSAGDATAPREAVLPPARLPLS